jgi:imidazolonepropionase-like amidohydrolase
MTQLPFAALLLTVIYISSAFAAKPEAVSESESGIAIVGAGLIDGTGTAVVADSIILIQGDRITAVGSRDRVDIPDSATIVDATGKFVMPGLIDLHNHYGGGRAELERLFSLQLDFGVTTARSLGADGAENLQVIAEAKAGKIEAPRLYTAGTGFSHKDGMPPGAAIQRPTSAADARRMVQELVAAEVDLIKMWVDPTLDGLLIWSFDWNQGRAPIPKISAEIRTALVAEATKHGIPAVAHIYTEADVRQLNSVGVRDFVHTVRMAPIDADFVQWAEQQMLSFAPALSKAQDSWLMAEHPELLDDPALHKAWGKERVERMRLATTRQLMLSNPQGAQLREVYGRMQRFVSQVHAGGVTIAVGSDSGAGNVPFGWGTHHEMKLLVEAGLTPAAAVKAGTANGAWVLEGSDAQFGTIEAGKLADLLVLSRDPHANIDNTRSIERVMQKGRWLER